MLGQDRPRDDLYAQRLWSCFNDITGHLSKACEQGDDGRGRGQKNVARGDSCRSYYQGWCLRMRYRVGLSECVTPLFAYLKTLKFLGNHNLHSF